MAKTLVKGIDISHWNTVSDWQALVAQGIKFVYIKASEGNGYVDPNCVANYENAKKAGLLVGFYHFARFSSASDALAEADHFFNVVGKLDNDLPHALDLETDDAGLSKADLTDYAVKWLNAVHAKTKDAVLVYTYPYFTKTQIEKELGEFPLWYANYSGNDADGVIWQDWQVHQTTSKGSLKGVAGNVDLDEMYLEIKKPAPVKTLPKLVNYTVKRGDTLSELASKYHTTVAYLVSVNKIKDKDLIRVGQVLKVPSTVTAPKKPSYLLYTVRSGDTLWDIARKYHTTVYTLAKVNHLEHADLIYPNQKLKIPN